MKYSMFFLASAFGFLATLSVFAQPTETITESDRQALNQTIEKATHILTPEQETAIRANLAALNAKIRDLLDEVRFLKNEVRDRTRRMNTQDLKERLYQQRALIEALPALKKTEKTLAVLEAEFKIMAQPLRDPLAAMMDSGTINSGKNTPRTPANVESEKTDQNKLRPAQ